jgi:hypothetical protein
MAITVASPQGATIGGVQVELMGPTERSGETNGSGQVSFPGLQAGTYRLRFTGDKVTAFEKEVTVRPGQIADVDVTLSAAPEPKVIVKEAPAPAPTTAAAGQRASRSIMRLANSSRRSTSASSRVARRCSHAAATSARR